tara:strand:+ start:5995 stop:6663 length:669 start_codon:yes stop_codon:yes gene_type:complete
MESSKYIEDLASIKSMMSKSSRFMSISGLSGILADVYALIAFFVTYRVLATVVLPGISIDNLPEGETNILEGLLNAFTGGYGVDTILALIGIITLAAAVLTGIILTIRKAKKHNEKIWDPTSRRLIANFAIPLAAGGIFCLVLLQYGIIGLVASFTLIFYGLALVNASKYTLGDIKYLGLANVIIGLISTQFIGYGLFFWALGFGVLHIIYGSLMYFKYDRN